MIRRDLAWVAKAVDGELVGTSVEIVGVGSDSRKVAAKNLFVPIVGEIFDGHDYVDVAIHKNAAAFLWQQGRKVPVAIAHFPHVVVKDTLLALQQMAKLYRSELSVSVICVTGSNGKTTTKEMISLVLARKFMTYKSPGNLNNHIGLPLSILAIPENAEMAVFELGMNHKGEIATLAEIAKPDTGVITMIGEAHIGLLGSRAEIAKAKWELIDALPSGGMAVLPAQEPLLSSLPLPNGVQAYFFGDSAKADVHLLEYVPNPPHGSQLKVGFSGHFNGADIVFEPPFMGRHLASDALAAISVGQLYGLSPEQSVQGLCAYFSDSMRQSVEQLNQQLYLINDAYNAAPSSMKGALEVMNELPVNVRIAVLGDMLELGDHAKALHLQVGEVLNEFEVMELIAVGDLAKWYIQGAKEHMHDMNTYEANDAISAADYLIPLVARHLSQGKSCAVLVKGSRRMGLEQVADALLKSLFPLNKE